MPPTDTFYRMFRRCCRLQDITALANWDVSKVKNMAYTFTGGNNFFYKQSQLKNVTALANWDVSNVENMEGMFSGCCELRNITALANWDVSNVKNMEGMFSGCCELRNIPCCIEGIKSYLRNLPKRSYPNQGRRPPPNSRQLCVSAYHKYGSIKEITRAPTQKEIPLQLPSDWKIIETVQWNP